MPLESMTSPRALAEAAIPALVEHEAEHGLLLGLLGRGREDPPPAWAYGALVRDGGRVVAVALRTDDKLVLSRAARDAVRLLAGDALTGDRARDIGAVLGPPDAVRAFVDAARTTWELTMRQGVYAVDSVVPPRGVPGSRRVADARDRETLIAWARGFESEALGETPSLEILAPRIDARIAAGGLHVWDVDGETVAGAGAAGPTPNGIRVNFVYTPPARRGRGYAGALVASLTQSLLDAGRAFALLHTDLANPTANRLYERLGYRRVADFERWDPR